MEPEAQSKTWNKTEEEYEPDDRQTYLHLVASFRFPGSDFFSKEAEWRQLKFKYPRTLLQEDGECDTEIQTTLE